MWFGGHPMGITSRTVNWPPYGYQAQVICAMCGARSPLSPMCDTAGEAEATAIEAHNARPDSNLGHAVRLLEPDP